MTMEKLPIRQAYVTRKATPKRAMGKVFHLGRRRTTEEQQRPELFLARVPPYNQLTEGQRETVAATMTWEVFPPGSVIILGGDTFSHCYLIAKGQVRISVAEEGRDMTLATLSDGECFGEISLLSEGTAMATVTAVQETLCLRQGHRQFVKTIEEHPAVHRFFTALAIARMRSGSYRYVDAPKAGAHPVAERAQLRISTLGRFEILKKGEPLTFGRKAQKKPLALLAALIALGGRQVSEERLTEFIWPDLDGGTDHDVFHTTLRRLRRLLGEKDTIENRAGKVSLSPSHLWIDTWAFEHVCDEAERLGKTGISSKLIECLRGAFKLYRGAFLASEDEFWVLSLRERLRNKFIRVVLRLGSCLERENKWTEAAECYEKGLAIDDTAEEIYQRLMAVHRQQGRNTEAAIVHECCRKLLKQPHNA